MDSVLQLLDELEEIMDSSRAVPFSNKVSVDKEEIYDIISEIRMKLPNELKQSKWVIEERNKILIDAQKEADEIVKNAEERLVRMIDDNEVTKKAYDQAANIIESAKKTAKGNASGRYGIFRKRTERCGKQAERTESRCLQRKHEDRRLLRTDSECTG